MTTTDVISLFAIIISVVLTYTAVTVGSINTKFNKHEKKFDDMERDITDIKLSIAKNEPHKKYQ